MTATTGALRPTIPVDLERAVRAAVAALLLTLAVAQIGGLDVPQPVGRPPAATTADAAFAREALGSLPMAWVANTGQTDAQVRFLAQGLGYGAFLTDTEAVVGLDGAVVRLGFDSGRPAPSLRPEQPLAATVSSFTGSDPATWQTASPTSAVVRYDDLWPGIDVTFRGNGSQLEWDLHLAAGADPAAAAVTVAGADRITVDGDRAALVLGESELALAIPAVWQTRPDGTRVERHARWELDGVTLRVVPRGWDPSLPGVIDPSLEWSTFLGGGHGGDGDERANAIAIDSSGNAYLTGSTRSNDFPTTAGAHDTTRNGSDDAFVTKIDPTGSAVVYSTFLGGVGIDVGEGVAVDGDGDAYVTGRTADAATDFPTTAGAVDTTHNGADDAFAAKLGATGALTYSTLLGGASYDQGSGVAVDAAGEAYVIGYTYIAAPGYPTTPGAYDTTYNGGTGSDAFVTKVNATGTALSYSTLIGGGGNDLGNGIAVDGDGSAYATGTTPDAGTDYPTTAGAYDTTHNGGDDVFATKLNPAGSALTYSTFLGGSGTNDGRGIALDSGGNAYVTGVTYGFYPTTAGAFDTSSANADAFVTKVNPGGSALVYSTYIGGASADYGYAIAVGVDDNAYLTGHMFSSPFPTTVGAYDTTTEPTFGDSFATRLNAAGSALVYSTVLGGAGRDYGYGIAVDVDGNAHVAGETGSTDTGGAPNNYPTTPGAYDTVHDNEDAFVTKVNTTGTALVYSTLVGGSDGTLVDAVKGVAADSTGVYLIGTTASNGFPTTAGAVDTTPNGGTDVFAAKLNPTGTALIYGTLLGGLGADEGYAISVDGGGNAHLTGTTQDASTDFPTTVGAYDTVHNGVTDAFASKLNPSGTALVYSTLLGGSSADSGTGIAVDAGGNAYLAGTAVDGATDYPTTAGAYNTTHNGTNDVFATKLNATGSAVTYSTFVGGGGAEVGNGIAVDSAGSVYLTGSTSSPTFPTTAFAYDAVNTGSTEAFATKLDPTGATVDYSTLLGGSAADYGRGIAVDGAGYAYLTGETWSSDFPTTAGAYDVSFNAGFYDAFATKLDPAGTGATYSTYLGGSSFDSGYGVAADSDGNAYLTGLTWGGSFPTTASASQTTYGGSGDAYAVKFSGTGALGYSSYLGGSGSDLGYGVAVGTSGRVAFVGSTASPGFPTTPGAFDTVNPSGATAGFVTVVNFTPFGAPNGCKNSSVAGAEIGMYPAQPGAQSGLRVSCTFNTALDSAMMPSKYTIHDFDIASYHNGSARTVTNTAAIASGATTFTLASFAGTGAWVNRPITAIGVSGLPARTFVKSISGTGLVTLSAPTTAAIPAGTSFKIDNTHARSVTDGATTAASTPLTSATASFTAADTGLSVSGTDIPDGTTATFVDPTTITLSNPANATGAGQTITLGATLVNTTTRVANDASNTSTTVISSPAAKFKTDDIGLRVTGAGIPAGTYIVSVAGSTATTTGGLTPNTPPHNLVIGEPSVTAPTSADTPADQTMQLDLDPALVAGADDCANGTPESVALVARWNNPGAFVSGGLSNTQPAGTKAIGQLYFDSSVVDFSAYVIERPLLVAGDPIGTTHYDLVFPFIASATAMCASATSPGLSFSFGLHAQTLSQAVLSPGTGKPGTAQLRSLATTASGGYSSIAYVTSDDPATPFLPTSEFNRLCIYPAAPAPVSFKCGNG